MPCRLWFVQWAARTAPRYPELFWARNRGANDRNGGEGNRTTRGDQVWGVGGDVMDAALGYVGGNDRTTLRCVGDPGPRAFRFHLLENPPSVRGITARHPFRCVGLRSGVTKGSGDLLQRDGIPRVVAAWAVDRLGRSLIDLLGFLEELRAKGIISTFTSRALILPRRLGGRCSRCSAFSRNSSGP